MFFKSVCTIFDKGEGGSPNCDSLQGCSAKKQHPKKAVHIKAAIKKPVSDLAVAKRQHI